MTAVLYESACVAAELSNPRPAWLTTPCPAWCENIHTDNDHPDDRVHYSAHHSVVLTTEETEIDRTSDGEIRVRYSEAELFLVQGYREAEPQIGLVHNELPGMRFTLTEWAALMGTGSALIAEAAMS